jgi:GABA permease
VGFLGVVGNYVLPGAIFGYLLATSGAIARFVYLVIALSHLRMRREVDAAGVQPAVRMWAFPTLTWLTIAFIAGVLVIMAILPGQRLELWFSLALAAVIVAIAVARHKSRSAQTTRQHRRCRCAAGRPLRAMSRIRNTYG